MIKTKKINKLVLVLTLALVLALALVIVSSATIVDTIEVDSLSQNSSVVFSSSGCISTAFISDGYLVKEIDIFEYDGTKPYYKTYIVSNIEAFQREWNGYTYSDFNELMIDTFRYFGFQEYQYNYLMSWSTPISQEQYNELQQGYNTLQGEYNQLQTNYGNLEQNYLNLSNSIPTLEQNAKNSVWQEVNTINRDMYIYGFSSNGQLLNDVYITSGATLREFIGLNYIAQRNNDLAEIRRLESLYNQLESSIPEKEENARQLGYQQGYNAADDFWIPVYQELENNYNTLNVENQQLKLDIKDSYNLGYSAGMTDGEHFEEGITSILSAPMYFLGNVLQFDVFGINVFSVVCSIFTLLIIAFVIKKLAN